MSFIILLHFKEAPSAVSFPLKSLMGHWYISELGLHSKSFYGLNELHVQPTKGRATPTDSLEELPVVKLTKHIQTFEIMTEVVQLKEQSQ